MKIVRLSAALLLLCGAAHPAALVRARGPTSPLPLSGLEPNRGQAVAGVLFLSRGFEGVGVTAQSVVYAPLGVALRLEGGAPSAEARFEGPLPGVVNSYAGSDPSKWITGIPRFSRAVVEDVYPGVDAAYEAESDGRFTVTLRLEAGVDPEAVVFELAEGDDFSFDAEGSLVVRLGRDFRFDPRLRFPAPVAVQPSAEPAVREARFRLLPPTRFGVAVDGWDPAVPLEIEIELRRPQHPYLGEESPAYAWGRDGVLLVAATIPDASGVDPYPTERWRGCGVNFEQPIPCRDVAVYKQSPAGELVFVSYLSGRTREEASFVGIAPDGAVVVAGTVESNDFPTTPDALQPLYAGPPALYGGSGSSFLAGDLFAARLDAESGALQASTYLGGPEADRVGAAGLGGDGSLYFFPKWLETRTAGMPTSRGALQPDCPDPCRSGYAARIGPGLDRMLYGTYLPGNVQATAALHSDGSLYYAGNAEEGFPTTPSAYQRQPVRGWDGVVARLDPDGESLLFGTYVGGEKTDTILRMAVAPDGGVWAAVSSFIQCCVDIDNRLVHFAPNGERLLADEPIDVGDIAVDSDGSLLAIASGRFPAEPDAFLAQPCAAPDLAYLKLNPSGEQLFASYLPAGVGYDFEGRSPRGLPLIPIAGERFEVVEDQPMGVFAGCVVDAAAFLGAPPAPGQIVTIFGSRMGPLEGVGFELENGRVPRSLSGVRVLVDGDPAPLLYASYWQVNAIMPYWLEPGSRPTIVVESEDEAGNALGSFYVERSALSLFRLNESPDRPAAALNEDGSVNSALNPARPGSIVALYGTGGGATVPPSEAGEATPLELRVLELPPRVFVDEPDGQELAVEFAGAAPGLVAGVTQINVRLPEDLPQVPGYRRELLPLRVASPGSAFGAGRVTVAVDSD